MKTTASLSILIIISALQAFPQTADSIKYANLDPYYFHLNYLKDDNAMLIDVREFFEFKKSRIKDATNIPSSGNLDYAADTIDKSKSLFLYCTTDFRSIRVAEKFAEKGFRAVYNLEGGIRKWKQDGFPVEKKRLKKPESTR